MGQAGRDAQTDAFPDFLDDYFRGVRRAPDGRRRLLLALEGSVGRPRSTAARSTSCSGTFIR
jgi:hypothetical protein